MHLSSRFDSVIAQPERLTSIESWHRHMPFAFCLLDMLKPQKLVELGTHRGDSYSAFCQAVVAQQLPTRCFAVDTWQGDSQAGHYKDEVFLELQAWHEPRYGHFSTLLRMTFDEALAHISDASVDLLHIDGLHTYEAVKHDFDSWLPKLSERAVVLFHDTNVHYDDFAVWQLWDELKECYPSFEFPFGFGLGVLAVGSQVPESVLEFLQFAGNNPREVIDYFFRHGDTAALRKANAELERVNTHLDSVGSQLQHARDVVQQRDTRIAVLNAELQIQQNARQQQVGALQQRLAALLGDEQVLRNALASYDMQAKMVLQSKFWRLRNGLMGLLGQADRKVCYHPPCLPAVTEQDALLQYSQRPEVSIIIPVYGGVEDTKACIEAVLAASYQLQCEVVVINDASPEPELVQWLNENAARFTLLHNSTNLGFVATVNRGMQLHPERDVVLVNSDTLVAGNWLDRLQQAAYAAHNIGSVTPLSNNATICSYPLFCQDNPVPEGLDIAQLDSLCSVANAGQVVDIPTAVGFCMYIRRACLQQAGLFDAELFGRGYGEENEFCFRSAKLGWRHGLAGDTFVYHKGGVSFAETQSENQAFGHAALTGLYPDYDWHIQQHIAQDPARRLRFAVDVARAASSNLPVILMVQHARGGGSERHLLDLVAQLAGQTLVFVLRPSAGGMLSLTSFIDQRASNSLHFVEGRDDQALLATLRAMGVSRLHYHHLIDMPESVLLLPQQLDCPFDVTVHDFYLACPQVTLVDEQGNYCGAPDVAGCNDCLRKRPVAGVEGIEQWRAQHALVLGGAERIFVPCLDTQQRMQRYFPDINSWVLALHEQQAEQGQVRPVQLQAAEPLRVLVLGALSRFKGADVLEAVAAKARAIRAPLEFHLLGYAYRQLRARPLTALKVHGEYRDEELAGLIESINPHVVWFPGNCPETWSYTLSAAFKAQLPVLAPQIGAFPGRLAGRSWSWLNPVNASVQENIDNLLEIRQALLDGAAPVVPQQLEADQARFFYSTDYQTGMGKAKDSPDWPIMHAQWQVLSQVPQVELLKQVKNQRLRALLVFTLRKGWLQQVLRYVPVGLQARLKRLLVR